MVVSGSGPATRAGVEILGAGGNAVDAAVATAFALAVSEPTQSGLGGRTQALVRSRNGDAYGMDATTEVPAGYDPGTGPREDYGYGAVAIPGTVAGLAHLLERFGTLPLDRVMAPAIRLADEGFPLGPGEASRIAEAAPELARSEGGRLHFLHPDGSAPRAGEIFVQPALAKTLRRVAAAGSDAFYRGELAAIIGAEMAENGGFVTVADLAAYRIRPSIVVEGRYRELELVGTYLPASGATTIEALQILESFDLAGMNPAQRTAVVAQALLLAFQDREAAAGRPDQDAARLTSAEWAASRAREVVIPELGAGGSSAAPSAAASGSHEPSRPGGDPWSAGSRLAMTELRSPTAAQSTLRDEPGHTTHVSVVDDNGMAVSMTQSLGPTGGARVASPELGFLYASTLGYLANVEPGDRPWSSQSPLILLREGELAYVLGGAGARRIISALVQTIVGLEDGGLPLEDALAAPRFHPTEDRVLLEALYGGHEPEEAAAGPEALGFEVVFRETGTYFARVNAISVDPRTGELLGVGDPRWPWSGAAGPGSPGADRR